MNNRYFYTGVVLLAWSVWLFGCVGKGGTAEEEYSYYSDTSSAVGEDTAAVWDTNTDTNSGGSTDNPTSSIGDTATQSGSGTDSETELNSDSVSDMSCDPSNAALTTYAVDFADMIISRWSDPRNIGGGSSGWGYTNGVVLRGIAEVYERTGDERYLEYIKRYIDYFLDDEGRLFVDSSKNDEIENTTHNLDTIQPAILLLFLSEHYPDDTRYLKAAEIVRNMFPDFPTNSVGGFWHKSKYPNEMWLDGLYMAEPFLAKYGAMSSSCGDFCIDTPVTQVTLLADQVKLPSGLLLHGWDEDHNAGWCSGDCDDTGLSPEVWSRGIGWYAMMLVDTIPFLPKDFAGRATLTELLEELAAGLQESQDSDTGLWCQVVGKCDESNNWPESSGSAMVIYAMKKAMDDGFLDKSYQDTVETAWSGLVTHMFTTDDNGPVIRNAAEGMSIQSSYSNYVGITKLSNSKHGLCAALLAAAAMEFPCR